MNNAQLIIHNCGLISNDFKRKKSNFKVPIALFETYLQSHWRTKVADNQVFLTSYP